MSKVTIRTFWERKRSAQKIALLTAYDYPSACLMDESGIDAILVGDSMGMAIMGLPDTLSVTLDDIVHHAKMVRRGARNALLIADLPFLSYQISPKEALRNAGRLVTEAGAEAVKLEGGADKFGPAIKAILDAGIPVMGHLGLTPQSIHQFGGFKVQGRDPEARQRLKDEALGLQEAGCFSLVLECIPAPLAEEITGMLDIPTIGIGAGAGCDGQVLVFQDILGWGKTRFAKQYADVRGLTRQAIEDFAAEVRSGDYPGEEHQYS